MTSRKFILALIPMFFIGFVIVWRSVHGALIQELVAAFTAMAGILMIYSGANVTHAKLNGTKK